MTMPRYIVERSVPKMTQEEWQAVGKQAVKTADEMPNVTWIKSSISESEGKTYCELVSNFQVKPSSKHFTTPTTIEP